MLYSAYLIESHRIDGKPRQHAIYLASIRDSGIAHPHRCLHFWQTIQTKMQLLGLSPEQQRLITKQLLERVPEVYPEVYKEQLEEADRRTEAILARFPH